MGIYDFFEDTLAELDKLCTIRYNGTPERETGSSSLTKPLKDNTMTNDFSFNKTQAKIHGLSVQVGELFAELYKDPTDGVGGPADSLEALEAYKSLRRLLPMESYGDRHVGATAAHKATQGA